MFYITLEIRLLLVIILLRSSIAKLFSWNTLQEAIIEYQLLPPCFVRPVAYALPFIEFSLGIWLLTGIELLIAASLTFGLLLLFTGAIVINLIRGRHIKCHCFGNSKMRIGLTSLIRNTLLVAITFSLVFWALPSMGRIVSSTIWQQDLKVFTNLAIVCPIVMTIALALSALSLLDEIGILLSHDREV